MSSTRNKVKVNLQLLVLQSVLDYVLEYKLVPLYFLHFDFWLRAEKKLLFTLFKHKSSFAKWKFKACFSFV